MAPALRRLAETLGLEETVRFTGFIPEDDLADYYRSADLFVLPTTALEGFGLPILESLACGTPVVGTAVGAIPEILGKLGSEFLVTDARPEGLARALAFHLSRGVSDDLRERCRRLVEERYGWETVVSQLEGELLALTAARPK
jgi:glycosyltransferase involved in cell wall biosynthesis